MDWREVNGDPFITAGFGLYHVPIETSVNGLYFDRYKSSLDWLHYRKGYPVLWRTAQGLDIPDDGQILFSGGTVLMLAW